MKAEKPLGRLQPVGLRIEWKNEATEFTHWLARTENLELLGQAIGVELELEDCEKKEYMEKAQSTVKCNKPLPQHWANYSVGRSGFQLVLLAPENSFS